MENTKEDETKDKTQDETKLLKGLEGIGGTLELSQGRAAGAKDIRHAREPKTPKVSKTVKVSKVSKTEVPKTKPKE